MYFRPHPLDRVLFPLVYILNRNLFMGFNRLVYLFALRLLGIGISWRASSGINLNEDKFLKSISHRVGDGIVFDIGASVGNFANAVRKYCPMARIICFEPHPAAYDNLRAHSHLEAYNVALSNHSGRARLYQPLGPHMSTVASLERTTLGLFGGVKQEYEVEMVTVEEMCNRLKSGRINLLKIDTEGFAFHVLEGAGELLKRKSIDLIEFEFVPACMKTGVYLSDFFDVLEGYEIYRLALNGSLIPLRPYDYRFCEIFTTQHLIAMRLEVSAVEKPMGARTATATFTGNRPWIGN